MRKPILNNFFGCMTLETGGKVIAWFTIVGGVIAALIVGIAVILSILGLGVLVETDPDYETLRMALIIFIVVFGIFAIYLVILILAGVFLLNGIKRRVHQKIMWMLVLLAIGVVLDFLTIFTSTSVGSIIINILAAIFAVYLFLTILSLYQKIKMENEQGTTNAAGGINYNFAAQAPPKATF